MFTLENIRSVRPFAGLPVKYLDDILGKKATKDLKFATPLEMTHVEWD